MTRKNIFCLVVDAMSFAYMHDDYGTTPFINRIASQGHSCVNMFSQGPYTEAALTPFYTGADNMDFGGNFFRGNETPKTIFEAFNENGYDVLNYTQPLIYPTTMHRGINEERYGVGYFFSAVYDYRINYYASLFEKGELRDIDYCRLFELLESNFAFWLQYLKECRDQKPVADFVNTYGKRDYDFDRNIQKVEYEYKCYRTDKMAYLHELFRQGMNHPVFAIEKYDMSNKADNDFVYNRIAKSYASFFRKLKKFNKRHNRGYVLGAIDRVCRAALRVSKTGVYNELKKFYYFLKVCDTEKEIDTLFQKKSNYKPEPTMLEYFAHFQNWYQRKDAQNPFFCMMHVSDLHTPEIFFSIDSNSVEEVEAELQVMSDYLDSLPDDFEGNVVYNLSMRYVDLCLEKMYERMEKMGILDNTVLHITADHGSSFRYSPIRETLVNNDYAENYNIPCILYKPGEIVPCVDTCFHTTKDMIKTLAVIADVDWEGFTGTNIIEPQKSNGYAIVEYMGSGCPDLSRKPLCMVIRNDDWTLGIRQNINGEFNTSNIVCVYNRRNDPKEQNNLLGKVDLEIVRSLHEVLRCRFERIREQA